MRHTIAGELHGTQLLAIVSDVPAGLRLRLTSVEADLARWAKGCSCEQWTPSDCVAVLSGISADGRTNGGPVSLAIDNRSRCASLEGRDARRSSVPRPGSTDLMRSLSCDADDCSAALECAFSNSDAALVAASSVAREFLADFGVEIHSYVTRVGNAAMRETDADFAGLSYAPLEIETSNLRCPSAQATRAMEEEIAAAREDGESLGGQIAMVVTGLAAGLGKIGSGGLAARLSAAAFSFAEVTGVSFGHSSRSLLRGSDSVDGICVGPAGFSRLSNIAGGIEGGLSTGLPLVMRIDAAPSPAFARCVSSVDFETLEPSEASSPDCAVCVVPGLAVAIESRIAFELASAYQERFGFAAMSDIQAAHAAYDRRLKLAAR